MIGGPVVRDSGIRKTYGRTVAVDDVSFEVQPGEIFGLIGPNGAGKTTTMECVEGLRQPDRGVIEVFGLDPTRDARALENRIGVQLQEAQLQKRIKVWEAVDLWASLYPTTVDADQLLDQLGLTEKRNAWFMTLSGGQKQRLFIALSLINDPDLVFLDELTTGLDPQARRTIWDLVRSIRERGATVFLTTHLMEEAERLCDHVAIIEHGRIIDYDTPAGLVARHCPERTVVVATAHDDAAVRFRALPSVDTVTGEDTRLRISGRGDNLVTEVIHCLSEHQMRVTDFRTENPTLEDVFLQVDRSLHPRLTLMGSFTPLRGLWKLTWLEIKIFAREPLGFIGSVAIPVVIFVVMGRTLGSRLGEATSQAAVQLRVGLPVVAAVFIAVNTVLSLVAIISIYREGGILKRLRATPLGPVTILVTHVLVKLILSAVTVILMIFAGRRYYPAGDDVPVVAFTFALLLSTWSILSIGFIIASVVPTARFAQPLGSLVLAAMMPFAFSGFLPFELPSQVDAVARFVPLTYAVSLLAGIWQGDPWCRPTSAMWRRWSSCSPSAR